MKTAPYFDTIPQNMYEQAMEVNTVVNKTDTKFTALLSSMLRPDIFFTVGPGFPTTYSVSGSNHHI